MKLHLRMPIRMLGKTLPVTLIVKTGYDDLA